MAWLFWLSIGAIVYVYAGYPLLLRVWARVRSKPVAAPDPTREPGITIVIAARNEAARLPARIDNLLSPDSPADKVQIVVVSDGSTDDTMGALARYRGVLDVIDAPAGGKALALNAGVAAARHDLIVYADARQVFAPDALRELVAPFADPAVGAVTGELLLDAESALFSNRREIGRAHV